MTLSRGLHPLPSSTFEVGIAAEFITQPALSVPDLKSGGSDARIHLQDQLLHPLASANNNARLFGMVIVALVESRP